MSRPGDQSPAHAPTIGSEPIPCSPIVGLLSEGPRWDARRDELLWVDILGSQLHRARVGRDGLLELIASVEVDRHVGAAAPAVGGGYVVAAGPGFLQIDSDGAVRELAQPEAGRTDVRMNDGACDPQGRFWAGTVAYDESPGAGTLYRLELDGTCTTVLTGLTISNGIGWSPSGATMYLADSGTRQIDAFDFAAGSGDLSRRRTIVRIDEPGVAPDGLTVDDQGDIWVALWGGRALGRYGPDGSRLGDSASAGRPADLMRVRRPRPRDTVRNHRPARARRGCPRSTTRRRAAIPHRRARRQRCAMRRLPRMDRSAIALVEVLRRAGMRPRAVL